MAPSGACGNGSPADLQSVSLGSSPSAPTTPHVFQWIRMQPSEGCDGRGATTLARVAAHRQRRSAACRSVDSAREDQLRPVRSMDQDTGLRTRRCGFDSCTGRQLPRFVQRKDVGLLNRRWPFESASGDQQGRRERWTLPRLLSGSPRGSSPRSATMGRKGRAGSPAHC